MRNYSDNNFRHDDNEELSIVQFAMVETGQYHDIHYRPMDFNLTASNEHTFREAILRSHEKNPRVSAKTFAGSLFEALAPSASVGSKVNITDGWGSARFRWFAEIEWFSKLRGTKVTQLVSGYTDPTHIRPTASGDADIDPSLNFYIASSMEMRNSRLDDGRYSRTFAQFKNSDFFFEDPNYRGARRSKVVKLMRPADIFTRSSQPAAIRREFRQENAYDSTGVVVDEAVTGVRREGSPANLLASIINSHSASFRDYPDAHTSRDDILNQTILDTTTVSRRNRFLSHMTNVLRSNSERSTFTYEDLSNAFDNIDNIVDVMLYDSRASDFRDLTSNRHFDRPDWKLQRHTMNSNTNTLHGSGLEDQAASILASSVPTIAWESGLDQLVFSVTNRVNPSRNRGEPYLFHITYAHSMTSIPPEEFIDGFKARLAVEILDNISFNGEVDFEFSIAMNARADIKMDILMGDARHPIPYCYPSFCANLYTPQLSDDERFVDRMTDAVQRILEFNSDVNEERSGFRHRSDSRDFAPLSGEDDDDSFESVFDRDDHRSQREDDNAGSVFGNII